MLLEPPEKVSQETITLDVREIEPLLQAPPMGMLPWPGAMITLKDGRTMYIREARLEEAPAMMAYMRASWTPTTTSTTSSARASTPSSLGWYRKRLKDPYTLVGLIDGEWVGFANGRLVSEDDQHQPAHDGARPRRPHRRDHVLRKGVLRLRDPAQQRVPGDLRVLQRLAPLGPRHGPADLPVAGRPARARWRDASTTSPRSTGSRPSRTTCSRWSAPTSCSTSRRRSSKPTPSCASPTR